MSVLPDLRIALRALARKPLAALLAVGTLALALGVTVAIFSVVDAVLLRPLPFPDAHQLVVLWETDRPEGSPQWRVTPADFVDWREQSRSFAGLAAFGSFESILTGRGEPAQLRGSRVTVDYLAALGVAPELGRWFTSDEIDHGEPVVVLGHDLWQQRFGGSPEVIGGSMTLGGTAYTIIGVLPRGMYPAWPVNGPRMHFDADHHDAWVPLPLDSSSSRGSHVLGVIGRLQPAATLAQARAELATIAARIAASSPDNRDRWIAVRPLAAEVTGSVRRSLMLLLGAGLLVLAIATANVAGLLAARAVSRRQEVAIRRAMGARGLELVRSFAAEAAVIAAAGAACSLPIAAAARSALVRLAPGEIPRLAQAALDVRVLALAGGCALLIGLALALVSLLAASIRPAAVAIRTGVRGASDGGQRMRLRGALVVLQIALSLALALAAVLLEQTFRRLESLDHGFSPRRTLSVDLALPRALYGDPGSVARFYAALLADLRSRPGVEAAQIAYDQPLESNWSTGFGIVGAEEDPRNPWSSELRFVSPGYFRDLSLPVVAGREFASGDDADHPGVAIVSREFARRFFGSTDPVGQRIDESTGLWTWGKGLPTRFEIVGVVGDVPSAGPAPAVAPALYLSAWQIPQNEMRLLVRGTGEPAGLLVAVRDAVRRLDAGQPLGRAATLDDELARAVAQPRLNLVLMATFGGLSLLLALVGTYGQLAHWVAARRREIGIRSALGGTPGEIRALVLRQGGGLALAGVLAGSLLWLALSRLLDSQLYGVSAHDPASIAAVVAAVAALTLVACALPAVRAARIDPAIVLRDE